MTMPEPIEPTADGEIRVEAPEPEDDPRATALSKARREAAGLRARLRAAEQAIEGYAAREGARDKAEVEAIAAEFLVEGTDIWRAQPNIQEFYDGEFREITHDRVIETAKALAAEKPHLGRTRPPPPTNQPLEGLRAGATPATKSTTPASWSAVIRGG